MSKRWEQERRDSRKPVTRGSEIILRTFPFTVDKLESRQDVPIKSDMLSYFNRIIPALVVNRQRTLAEERSWKPQKRGSSRPGSRSADAEKSSDCGHTLKAELTHEVWGWSNTTQKFLD